MIIIETTHIRLIDINLNNSSCGSSDLDVLNGKRSNRLVIFVCVVIDVVRLLLFKSFQFITLDIFLLNDLELKCVFIIYIYLYV
jgi:hypothetical protein